MLNETITLSFSDDGVATATNHVFKKKTHADSDALYRNETTILAPELPCDQIQLFIEEARATSTFYGTRRNRVTIRQESEKPTPTGEKLLPIVFKVESSIPIGYTAAEITGFNNKLLALLAHAEFAKFLKYQEI